MRIVGGEFRGRRLSAPKTDKVRPTSDRNRESLFNILSNRLNLDGKRVIDLFAGTGALGLEAISRGAAYCLFVDDSAQGRALIRANVEALGLTGKTRLFRRDATKLGPCGNMQPFDLAFLDPPYGHGLGEQAIESLLSGGWLADDAIIVLEERADALPETVCGCEVIDRRVMGETGMLLLAMANAG